MDDDEIYEGTEKFEEEIKDVGIDNDIQINPVIYLNKCLLKAIESLTNPNVKDGLLQFWVLMDIAEGICKSMDWLPDKYDKEINELKDKKEFKEEKDNLTKNMKLSKLKFTLIMEGLKERKPLSEPLSI